MFCTREKQNTCIFSCEKWVEIAHECEYRPCCSWCNYKIPTVKQFLKVNSSVSNRTLIKMGAITIWFSAWFPVLMSQVALPALQFTLNIHEELCSNSECEKKVNSLGGDTFTKPSWARSVWQAHGDSAVIKHSLVFALCTEFPKNIKLFHRGFIYSTWNFMSDTL